MMNGWEKSDPLIVAMKSANKAGKPAAELMEPSGGAKGTTDQQSMHRTQCRDRESMSQALDRVRQAAKQRKEERFTALFHHLNVDLLRMSYFWLKRDAAPGVDGVTWEDYGEALEARLEDLHARIHRGAYRAQPSRRKYIPKPDGRQRPLGIAALEDKIVQRAVVEVLNGIYEEDFLGFSYGFRPGRGQHDALDALVVGLTYSKVNWVLDADIAGFFDTVDHEWLIRFLEHRVGDQRMIRLIRKWLKVGVMEDGEVTRSECGTPQGAVVSPLLANIYLHYIFDLWANQWRGRHARGEVIIMRYADDIIVGFQHETDAKLFLADLTRRMGEFMLSLHPEKTRLVEFGRFTAENRKKRGQGKPETFTFLGFTHICGQSQGGRFQVWRKSRRDRMGAKLRAIKEELERRRHHPIRSQGEWLHRVVAGFFNYHAVPTNFRSLSAFRYHVMDLWRRSLRRRSQKDRTTWDRIAKLADFWLPKPKILHPWPSARFAVKHPRWEPGARIAHAGICAGGAR